MFLKERTTKELSNERQKKTKHDQEKRQNEIFNRFPTGSAEEKLHIYSKIDMYSRQEEKNKQTK